LILCVRGAQVHGFNLRRIAHTLDHVVSHYPATHDGERPNPTLRTQISRADVRVIDSFALEIATDQHVAKVGVLLVRAGDVGTVLDTLVHQKTRLEADGSDVAGNRARGGEVGVVREL